MRSLGSPTYPQQEGRAIFFAGRPFDQRSVLRIMFAPRYAGAAGKLWRVQAGFRHGQTSLWTAVCLNISISALFSYVSRRHYRRVVKTVFTVIQGYATTSGCALKVEIRRSHDNEVQMDRMDYLRRLISPGKLRSPRRPVRLCAT